MANAFLLRPLVPASLTMTGTAAVSFDFSGGVLPTGATLARASAGTRYSSSGALVSEAANVARFDYDPASHALLGLLVEPAATNVLLRSAEFDNGAWTPVNCTVSGNASTAPDGTTTADRLTISGVTSGNTSFVYNTSAIALSAGQWTLSVWVKLVSGSGTHYLELSDGSSTFFSGAFTATGSWQRVGFTATVASGNWYVVIGGDRRSGSGQADTAAGVIDIWGAQLESGSAATSYIATSSGAAARAADALTLDMGSAGFADGSTTLRLTFDNGSTQDVTATIASGKTVISTGLNRPRIMLIAPPGASSGSAPTAGAPGNLLLDYAGIICAVAGTKPQIVVDLGTDIAIDTAMVFGIEQFPTGGSLIVDYATAAQGPFSGSYATDTSGAAYAGIAALTSGKGVSLWTLPAAVTARYVRLSYAMPGGASGALRASRLVIGKRFQPTRNFSYGGGFGVRDLGSLDFSRRGVLLRARGAKLRTAQLTFSYLQKDEAEASMKPLLEYLGNTECVALVTDPAADPQRQNRCYFGPLVGDVGQTWKTARSWETKLNLVSLF